ncbi:NUDIX domain-containing protein [Rhodobacteraceae bacterium CCMM004]|nr:NUDIX domain-containing protein [Rhodobacteraceae bacterium CCMM004]
MADRSELGPHHSADAAAGTDPFLGAKLAILVGERLVTLLRDDLPGLPWAGHWDLPGGGREDGESPAACALRETAEETGLRLSPDAIVWARHYGRDTPGGGHWFMAALCPRLTAADLRLGDEGQALELMTVADYLSRDNAIPHFQDRLRECLRNLDRPEGFAPMERKR